MGLGTYHMILCLWDRKLQLMEISRDGSAVIMTSLDWAAAFDFQDYQDVYPAKVRPLLIPLLHENHKMCTKHTQTK